MHKYFLGHSSSCSDEEGDLSPDRNLLSSESESEEESSGSESENELPRQSMHPADNGLATVAAKCLVVFICLWQAAFRLPDIAIDMLLKFLVTFFKVIADKCSVTLLASVASKIPSSIYRLRKYLDSTQQQSFIEYDVCPVCFSLYTMEQCVRVNQHDEKVPQTCSFIRFPNHPLRHLRKVCGASLVKKIHLMGGKIECRPR